LSAGAATPFEGVGESYTRAFDLPRAWTFAIYAAAISHASAKRAAFGSLACGPIGIENRLAMMVRLGLTSMSSTEGSRLVRYQGERRRRSETSSGAWPESAYQTIARVRRRKPNGAVRSTARRVRFSASPTPTSEGDLDRPAARVELDDPHPPELRVRADQDELDLIVGAAVANRHRLHPRRSPGRPPEPALFDRLDRLPVSIGVDLGPPPAGPGGGPLAQRGKRLPLQARATGLALATRRGRTIEAGVAPCPNHQGDVLGQHRRGEARARIGAVGERDQAPLGVGLGGQSH
jgi:hypothetical protein